MLAGEARRGFMREWIFVLCIETQLPAEYQLKLETVSWAKWKAKVKVTLTIEDWPSPTRERLVIEAGI